MTYFLTTDITLLNGKSWLFCIFRTCFDGYTSVYTPDLKAYQGMISITGMAFVAKPYVKHLKQLYPNTTVEVFLGMNHGQLLIDHPEDVAKRISDILS